MKKKITIAVLLAAVAGLGVGLYLYNKPHRTAATEDAAFTMSASDLLKEYKINEIDANAKYLDKIIAVRGTIQTIEPTDSLAVNLYLNANDPMAAISCSFKEEQANSLKTKKVGDSITVKGICTGILTDVELMNCATQ